MSDANNAPSNLGSSIKRADIAFLVSWVVVLVLLSLFAGFTLISNAHQNKKAAILRHQARVHPDLTEAGKTGSETDLPPDANPVDVRIGIYLDRIVESSIKDTGWTVDFYIWFNWADDAIIPGESFQVVDGHIETKEKLKENSNAGKHYALYRVVARITKFFNVSRFPCDDHLLTIRIEDREKPFDQLRFVADEQSSKVSSRVKTPGYSIYEMTATVKPHSYKTARGDPQSPPDSKITYSQFTLGLWIKRSGWGYYVKLFQGLFSAVAIALLALFIKPTHLDPRFGLGIGAFFAAVANSYIVSSLLPDTGIMTLADTVNGLGLAMIFLTLVQSTVSLYIADRRGKELLSRWFDKISFLVFVVAYININLALPIAASL